MEPAVAKDMVKGSADTLNSQFYIGYNMLLNLIRSMYPTQRNNNNNNNKCSLSDLVMLFPLHCLSSSGLLEFLFVSFLLALVSRDSYFELLFAVEGIQPENMLMNSFHQFQNNQSVPKLKDGSHILPPIAQVYSCQGLCCRICRVNDFRRKIQRYSH